MRVALISDLHGNELAFQAVLSDMEGQRVDRVVCLGDVATLGPRPVEVLGRLRELACDCVLGNHDEFLLEPSLVAGYAKVPVIADSVRWTLDRMGSADLDFVRTFKRSLEIELDPGVSLFAFHGTPDSNVTDLLATTPAADVDVMLGARRAAVMTSGHTHLQMLRKHRGMLLVNPGSVGMPFYEYVGGQTPRVLPCAEYAIVESRGGDVSVTLHRIALDPQALAEAARSVDNPLSPSMASMYAS